MSITYPAFIKRFTIGSTESSKGELLVCKCDTAEMDSVLDVEWCFELPFAPSASQQFASDLQIAIIHYVVSFKRRVFIDSFSITGNVGVPQEGFVQTQLVLQFVYHSSVGFCVEHTGGSGVYLGEHLDEAV